MTPLLRALATTAVVSVLVVAAGCDDESPTSPTEETITFQAQLSPANEVPAVTGPEASGTGTATITLRIHRDAGATIDSATADFNVTLSGFPPATALTMAHIHTGAAGTNGDIVVNTGLTAGEVVLTTGSGSFARTNVGVAPALTQQIVDGPGGFYFNVHSALNGSGMARGQLVRQ
jgi:hypothetical protein